MGLLHGVAVSVGKALKRARAGEDKLASRRLDLSGVARIDVTSHAFVHGGAIPREYAMQGRNVSPPLSIRGVPPQAEEVVVLCEDPDAPLFKPFVHWILKGVSPSVSEIPEGIEAGPMLHTIPGAKQGKNTMRRVAYDGPAPPPGHGPHRYHFQVFALDRPLPSPTMPPTRDELLEQMRGHVIAYGDLVGTYQKT